MTTKNKDLFIEKDHFLKIQPDLISDTAHLDLYPFIESIQKLIIRSIKLENFEDSIFDNSQGFFSNLFQKMPIVQTSSHVENSSYLSLCILCHGKSSFEAENSISEMIRRSSFFASALSIAATRSLRFSFLSDSMNHPYHFMEFFINIVESHPFSWIEKKLASLIKEIRIHMLSSFYARSILQRKDLSLEEQSSLLYENLSAEIDPKNTISKYPMQTQGLLQKLSTEKKLSQIKENLNHLMNRRPEEFDRNIFDDIYHVRLLFINQFSAIREVKHLSRIISFFYLFNKKVKQESLKSDNKSTIFLRLLRANLSNKKNMVLGIVCSFSFSSDNYLFEKRHLIYAMNSCIKDIIPIKYSCIIDRRDAKIRSFYIEIEKRDRSNFSFYEMQNIKKNLPDAILSHVEKISHSIFQPRNEEEVLRNIILLSKQLKYVKDMPQAIISFDEQTTSQLSFIVILVRLLNKKTTDLKNLFSFSKSFLSFTIEDIKTIGLLKNKYMKEAGVFKVSLNKTPFFRSDHSVDLQNARQTVCEELSNVIGQFRDYNGGMLSNQTKVLLELKKHFSYLSKPKIDLLESFFYSIKPGFMQNVLPIHQLESLFNLLLQIIKKQEQSIQYKIEQNSKFLLVMIQSTHPLKEALQNKITNLKIATADLISTSITYFENHFFGLVYRYHKEEKKLAFLAVIESFIKEHLN